MHREKPLTDDEKYMQNQLQMEQECRRLQREFLILDKAQQHSVHAKGRTLLKTTKVIELYQKEHSNILNNLKRATDLGQLVQNRKDFDALADQLDNLCVMEAEVSAHKQYIEEIDEEIKRMKKFVEQLEKRQVSDKQMEERARNAATTVQTLENKLEIQMIKFGTICSKNKELRRLIDHHLAERRVFMKQWNRLIGKLAEGKQIMMDLIEQATIAFNQREEWCQKLQMLRVSAHRELLLNGQEVLQLKMKEDNCAKLEEFFRIKGQKRIMKDLEERMKQKRMKRQQVLEEKLVKHRDMLVEIQRFVKETEMRKIAKRFITQDELNMSNFKYIIEMIGEMEMMGDDLGYLHLDIEENHRLSQVRERGQKLKLDEWEAEYEDSKAEASDARCRTEETDSHYQQLLNGVDSLFKLCKCDKDPLLKLLGDNTEVKFYNVGFYLKLLESKVHQLLIHASYNATIATKKRSRDEPIIDDQDPPPKIYPIEQIIVKTPCSLCVEHEMVSDIVDTLQHVVTRKRAKEMLTHRLELPGGYTRLHKVSDCQLPKSRKMIQKRYE